VAEQAHGRIHVVAQHAGRGRAALGERTGEDFDLAEDIAARYEECRAVSGLGRSDDALERARRHGFRQVGRHSIDLSPIGQKQY
jgi:hypothetical protein